MTRKEYMLQRKGDVSIRLAVFENTNLLLGLDDFEEIFYLQEKDGHIVDGPYYVSSLAIEAFKAAIEEPFTPEIAVTYESK